MARDIASIKQQIIATLQADPVLAGLDVTSSVSITNLLAFVVAASQGIEEQLYDLFIAQTEAQASILPPGTPNWIQEKAFEFQYSSTVPQIIQFSTASIVPYYPVINNAYKIITNCSVQTARPGVVYIKVAKGASTTSTPQPLLTTELQALQYYFNTIKPAGIQYFCASENGDRLFSQYTIQYQGIYASTIAASLLAAYNNYLFNIPFGGVIKKIDVDRALMNVPGVLDVKCNNMVARAYSMAFGDGVIMVSSLSLINWEYTVISGYILDEDTSGQDFISQLTLEPR